MAWPWWGSIGNGSPVRTGASVTFGKSFSVPRQPPLRGQSTSSRTEELHSLHSVAPGGLSSAALIQKGVSRTTSFLMRGGSGLNPSSLEDRHSIERSGPSGLSRSLESKPLHSPWLSGRHDGSFIVPNKEARRDAAGGGLAAMAILDEDEKARKTVASHTASCMVIDMGEYNFAEYQNTDADADATGRAALRGFHVVQVLAMDLACRAFSFPDADDFQVSPAFFDSPGGHDATFAMSRPIPQSERAKATLCFCRCSKDAFKALHSSLPEAAEGARNIFNSCVRTTLLLAGGYECQEKDGIFMLAFHTPRMAIEWSVYLQIGLLRCDWDEALESLPETCSQFGDDGELLFKGLSAEVGIYEGQMAKVCPHTTTGRTDYFGMAVNRAARFMSAACAGQVLIEESLMDEVVTSWGVDPSTGQQVMPSGQEDVPDSKLRRKMTQNCHLLATKAWRLRQQKEQQRAPRRLINPLDISLGRHASLNGMNSAAASLRHTWSFGRELTAFPVTQQQVEICNIGRFAFRGVTEMYSVVTVYPGSLQGRLALMPSSMLQKGKATCLEENVYVKFQAIITLHDIFHLPLVPAEYIHSAPDPRKPSFTTEKAAPPKNGQSRLSIDSNTASRMPTDDLQNLAEAISRKADVSELNNRQPAYASEATSCLPGQVAAVSTTFHSREVSESSAQKDHSRKIAAVSPMEVGHMPQQKMAQQHKKLAATHVGPLQARHYARNPLIEQESTISGATSIVRLNSVKTDSEARLRSGIDDLAPELKQQRAP
ncbi:hypothetical protein WJX74_000198 [Apatococcus lobatus]|uniref:Guanylate cyclase domain-containing protein n=1 Tax=Apatococcus lobatus TaxID=904363 RepID=A0AAW1RKR7_9CHLO